MAFLVAVDDAVALIGGWPSAGSLIDEVDEDLEVRRQPVRRLPYHVA